MGGGGVATVQRCLCCFQEFWKEMRLCLQIIIAIGRGAGARGSNLYNPSGPRNGIFGEEKGAIRQYLEL